MYQLMIVDDEPTAVNSLVDTIPWQKLAIRNVFRAYSAKEALQIAETEPIDCVITDIRMPGMSGLELIRRLRELRGGTSCIVVTGHAEFEYAQQAIQLQTVDYLLKPVSDERLLSVVRGVVERMDKERQSVGTHGRAQTEARGGASPGGAAAEPFLPALREPLSAPVVRSLYEPPSLAHLLAAGMREEAKRKLYSIFAELAGFERVTRAHMAEVRHMIVAAAFQYAHMNNDSQTEWADPESADGFERLGEGMTLEQFREWVFAWCERLIQWSAKENHDTRGAKIKSVIDYIHAQLETDVSLQTLAEQVKWHPVYLSKTFKQETGEALSDYLLRIRMERAIQLLRFSEMKIYEVTAKVGYMNTPHFIKVFKKMYGVTPQEFREMEEDC